MMSSFTIRLKSLIFALLLVAPQMALAGDLPTDPKDIYFIKMDTSKSFDESFKNAKCENMKQSLPGYKSVDDFMSTNNCKVRDDSFGLTVVCQAEKDGRNVYLFEDQDGCKDATRYVQNLISEPGLEKDIADSHGAKWFLFEIYLEPTPHATECVESSLNDPHEVLKTDNCEVNSSNHMLQSFKCSKPGSVYLKGFVKSKALCERAKDLVMKDMHNAEKGSK